MNLEPDRAEPDYKLRLKFRHPDTKWTAEFLGFPVAAISDALRRRNTLPPNIKPAYSPMKRFAGPALTVHVTPGDELLALKAIHEAEPGDVVVVAGAWSPRFSLWGGVMSTLAASRGIAGLVTDGLVRDTDECRRAGFPIFSAGVTPHAPCMDVSPGEMNFPISIGPAFIEPGDLVVTDEDGVVIVPQALIPDVATAVHNRLEKEAHWHEQIAGGEVILRDAVEKALASRKVLYVDGDEDA